MYDEAVVSYKDMIEQNGLGLRWLRDTFGCASRPRAAWQIDTFGHTRGQAEMFSLFGYDAVYFARLDLDELAQRFVLTFIRYKLYHITYTVYDIQYNLY